jgi:hypothetical protein
MASGNNVTMENPPEKTGTGPFSRHGDLGEHGDPTPTNSDSDNESVIMEENIENATGCMSIGNGNTSTLTLTPSHSNRKSATTPTPKIKTKKKVTQCKKSILKSDLTFNEAYKFSDAIQQTKTFNYVGSGDGKHYIQCLKCLQQSLSNNEDNQRMMDYHFVLSHGSTNAITRHLKVS